MPGARYLGLALVAEGPTDHRFLTPLLRRVLDDLCRTRGRQPIDVGPMVPILPRAVPGKPRDRAEEVAAAALGAAAEWTLLFIHADGGARPARARQTQVVPAIARIGRETKLTNRACIPLVPVREMEAWTLVDAAAIRAVLGSTLSDVELGLPTRARDVERIADPKRALRDVFLRVSKTAAANPAAYLESLGEAVAIERLKKLPAFEQLWATIEFELVRLQYVR